MGAEAIGTEYEYISLHGEIKYLHNKILSLPRNNNDHIRYNEIEPVIRIGTDTGYKFLKPSDVLMIKSDSNYSTIYLTNGLKIFTSRTLKYWFEKFKSPILFRIHRSYVINKNKIDCIPKNKSNAVFLCGGPMAFYSRKGKIILNEIQNSYNQESY